MVLIFWSQPSWFWMSLVVYHLILYTLWNMAKNYQNVIKVPVLSLIQFYVLEDFDKEIFLDHSQEIGRPLFPLGVYFDDYVGS